MAARHSIIAGGGERSPPQRHGVFRRHPISQRRTRPPNRQQIAALAGLAPYDRDSGNRRGKRTVYGGRARARVRTALYMAALTATRCNPMIRAMYQRLLAAGKAKKVAICACARKLLVHLNSLLAAPRTNTLPGEKPAGA